MVHCTSASSIAWLGIVALAGKKVPQLDDRHRHSGDLGTAGSRPNSESWGQGIRLVPYSGLNAAQLGSWAVSVKLGDSPRDEMINCHIRILPRARLRSHHSEGHFHHEILSIDLIITS